MNFRTSGILLLALAVMASFYFYYRENKPVPERPKTVFMYQFDISDIVQMDVHSKDRSMAVKWDPTTQDWSFVDGRSEQVEPSRANGLRILLSGPGTHRQLNKTAVPPDRLAEYGLAKPEVFANIALKNGQTHRVLIGALTPDGGNYYTKNGDDDSIYLVDVTWGNEIIRFVNEPPILKSPGGDTNTPS